MKHATLAIRMSFEDPPDDLRETLQAAGKVFADALCILTSDPSMKIPPVNESIVTVDIHEQQVGIDETYKDQID